MGCISISENLHTGSNLTRWLLPNHILCTVSNKFSKKAYSEAVKSLIFHRQWQNISLSLSPGYDPCMGMASKKAPKRLPENVF